jgi:hypothetical protein
LRKRDKAGQADQTDREQTCSSDAEDIPPGYSRSTIQGPIRRATLRLLQWHGFPILPGYFPDFAGMISQPRREFSRI